MNQRKLFLIFAVIVFLLLENLLFLYNRSQFPRPILGIKVPKKFDSKNALKLSFGAKEYRITKNDVAATIDYQKTLDQLASKGRNGNVIQNIITQNAALLGLVNIPLQTHLSKELLLIKVLSIADEINKEPQPPMPDFTGNIANTLPAKKGVKVDTKKLSQIIMQNIFTPPVSSIPIPTIPISKSFNLSNLEAIRKQAIDLTSKPIQLVSAGVSFTLTPNDLRSLATVKEIADPKNPNQNILTFSINTHKLNQKLDSFSEQLEKATNAEFNEYYIRALIYSQFFSNTRTLASVPTIPLSQTNVLGTQTKNGQKIVYLTFDDGPNLIYQPMLLDILKAKGVHATFYFVGSNSQLYKTVTQRTIAEGHVVGNHTLTHPLLPKLPPRKILDEIKSTEDILNSFLAPNKITLFRPPFGGVNSTVYQYAKDLGLKTEFWSVDPRDWTEPATTDLIHRAVDTVKNGDVILLHSNHFSTVKALPAIIDTLQQRGFQFEIQS